MKIALVTRINDGIKWGGDLKAFQVIQAGLNELGHQATLIPSLDGIGSFDFVFLTISCYNDLRCDALFLELSGQKWGLIAFHENLIEQWGPAQGLFQYVRKTLDGQEDEGFPFTIERLFEMPHLVHYYAPPIYKAPFVNYEVLKKAHLCIASSPTEAKIILRDCPSCNVKTVLLTPGLAEGEIEPTDEFLKFTALSSRGYILQIGRFEPRKNHLATILATKDIDLPLVFIATAQYHATSHPGGQYEMTSLEAAFRFRKAPTYVIHQNMPNMRAEPLHILQMPGGKKLSDSMLLSAHAHAALHLHPAFSELPGYTYLESAKLGVPTIASAWSTLPDYLDGNPTLDGLIDYAIPYDLPHLKTLVEKKLSQKRAQPPCHPIFNRRAVDVARDLLAAISH